jgi:hypothetical protein
LPFADKLITSADSQWVFKNKDHGMMAAVASLGMVHAWNETQIDAVDKYLQASEEYVRAGAILGLGVMTSGLRNLDVDPMQALLSQYLEEGNTSGPNMKVRLYPQFRLQAIGGICINIYVAGRRTVVVGFHVCRKHS